MKSRALEDRLKKIKTEIEDALSRARRDPNDVTLVAVSKRFPEEVIEQALALGLRVFGENYVQEGGRKVKFFRGRCQDMTWHLIGHLQKNKAKSAIEYFDWIETVDSIELVKRLERVADGLNKDIQCLIQVNISMDPGKSGLHPQQVRPFFKTVRDEIQPKRVKIKGLMTIPQYSEDPCDSRKWYRELRELRDRLLDDFGDHFELCELSMGMSHDFKVAIEEGATFIRVGQALFGPRPT